MTIMTQAVCMSALRAKGCTWHSGQLKDNVLDFFLDTTEVWVDRKNFPAAAVGISSSI